MRLVPISADRESKLARLIASGETSRLEWESLFRQVADLFSDDVRSIQAYAARPCPAMRPIKCPFSVAGALADHPARCSVNVTSEILMIPS